MKRKLFKKTFKKADLETGQTKKHSLANHLSFIITNDYKYATNSITFVRYFEKYIENNDLITSNPKVELLDCLSKYIGYNSYEDYVIHHQNNAETQDLEDISKEEKQQFRFVTNGIDFKKTSIISILVLTIITILIVNLSNNNERWMQWKNGEYMEVEFDESKFSKEDLEVLDKKKLEGFKQIKNPDCHTIYFSKRGKPVTWYYKVKKGILEVFTGSGFHPLNGKPLKPITEYMIKEHICAEYHKRFSGYY